MKGGAGVIVGAIIFAGIIIAVAIGLGLGLRPIVVGKESNCPDPIIAPPAATPRPTPRPTPRRTPRPTTPAPTTTAAPEELKRPKSAVGDYRIASVHSDNPICSQIGMDIMVGRAGSAMDGAIATMICLGTTNFHCSGLGGGHFTTVYDKRRGQTTKAAETFIAREAFPLAGTQNYYVDKTKSSVLTGTAVGVPGELHGLYTAWLAYGRVPWADLIEPSIKLSEGGFSIHKSLAVAIQSKKDAILKPGSSLRDVLTKSDGTLYKEGEILRRPRFSQTLRTIAQDPYSFYNGSLADDIVADIQEAGGIISKEDLIQYRTRTRTPIAGRLPNLGLTMYGVEPPSSGVVVQYIMQLLDGFNFNNESLKDTATAIETYQKMIEVFKFGFGRRSALGDRDYFDIEAVLRNMTSDAYIDAIRLKVDTTMTWKLSYYDHAYDIVNDAGTAHISVLAPDGGAVGLTGSINYLFGSEVYGRRTGIMFNDEMDDFSIPGAVNIYNISASPSNYPAPRKMPMSSMSPTILLNDQDRVAYISGGSGGPRIISAMTYVALHNLYIKLGLPESTDRARLHHQLLPNVIQYEDGFDPAILAGLRAKQHEVRLLTRNSYISTVKDSCAICTQSCPLVCVQAVSDGRKGGAPYGY